MGQAACHPDRGIPEWTVCNPTKPDRARRSGFDYGEGGYDPNKCNVGFNEENGRLQIEIKGLVAPKSEEAQRICQQDLNETLQAAETARTASRPTSDLSAYDAYLRAHAMFFTTGKQIPQALALLEEAIARDPHYGPALACAALCCMRLVSDGAATDQEANRQKGIDFAHRALEVAGNDPGALADAAMVLACFGDDIDAMMALVDRALAVNPSYARGWHVSGFLRLWAGQPGLAIEHAERALRFSPRGLTGMTSYLIGAALFFSRDFKGAVPKLRVAIEDMPVFPTPYRFIAACYAHMGLLDEARAMIARLRSITSEVTVNYPLPFRDPQHRELYFSGLRLAMGEAT